MSSTGADRGYLSDAAGIHSFNCAGASAIFAESINDHGGISGDYFDQDGNMHAFIATLPKDLPVGLE